MANGQPHIAPCQWVLAHEGAISGLATSVKHLVSATEKLSNAMETMSRTVTDISRIDRDEYESNKEKIQDVGNTLKEWHQEWQKTLEEVNSSLKRSEEWIKQLEEGVSHLGWLNKFVAYAAAHPKFEKMLFAGMIFVAIQYLWEHGRSMWNFLVAIIHYTGWKLDL